VKLYKSYNWRTKDPIIDAIFTGLDDAGMTINALAEGSNVAKGTIRNWRNGKVRTPKFMTSAAAIRAMGADGIMFDADGKPRIVGIRRVNRPKLKVVGSAR
jgi:hypothetical protein